MNNYGFPGYNAGGGFPPMWIPPAGPRTLEKREIRKTGNFIGGAFIICIVLMQFVFSIFIGVMSALGAADILQGIDRFYGMNYWSFLAMYMAVYIIVIGAPGPLMSLFSGRGISPFSPFPGPKEKPGKSSLALVIMAGMGIFVVANLSAGLIAGFFYSFGVEPPDIPSFMVQTPQSLAVNLIMTAVLPALLEEMLFRGYLLRAALPYGRGTAIMLTSLLFGLMHGNIVQVPFAFLLGLMFGFIVVRTGSIWTAVALHFLNNAISVVVEYCTLNMTDERLSSWVNLGAYMIMGVIGLVALVVLLIRRDPVVMPEDQSEEPRFPREMQFPQQAPPQQQMPPGPVNMPYGYVPPNQYPQQPQHPQYPQYPQNLQYPHNPQYAPNMQYPPQYPGAAWQPPGVYREDVPLTVRERAAALWSAPAMVVGIVISALLLVISMILPSLS